MKRKFAFFLLQLIIITGAFSIEPPNNKANENEVTAISISGLKRTKPHIVENPLQKFIGRDYESIDTNEVIAILKGINAIEALTVEFGNLEAGEGKVLVVTVREKWSIFPVPFFSINSGKWSAGGAFMDANAFGINNTMVLAGIYGSTGGMGSIMYFDSPKTIGDFGWSLMGMFFLSNNETTDQNELLLRRFDTTSINANFGLAYKNTELITSNINVSYHGINLQDTEKALNAPDNDVHAISISPGVSLRNDTWDGYFLNGINASLKYNYTFVIDADDVHSVSLKARLDQSIISGLRFTAKSGIVFATPAASPFFESSQSNAAVNILPQSYSALDLAGLSLGIEKFLFKFSFGSISLSAAYQAVYSHGDLLHNQFDHGVVAMLQMYFSKVAIPGMGLGAAYNVDKDVWQFAFNIGMMF